MSTFEEVTEWLRKNHKIAYSGLELQHWRCSCGAEGAPGFGHPTHRQALARAERHLQAQRRARVRAIEGGS